jgi:hypothetical protein
VQFSMQRHANTVKVTRLWIAAVGLVTISAAVLWLCRNTYASPLAEHSIAVEMATAPQVSRDRASLNSGDGKITSRDFASRSLASPTTELISAVHSTFVFPRGCCRKRYSDGATIPASTVALSMATQSKRGERGVAAVVDSGAGREMRYATAPPASTKRAVTVTSAVRMARLQRAKYTPAASKVELIVPPRCVRKVECRDDWHIVGGVGRCEHLHIEFVCYRVKHG